MRCIDGDALIAQMEADAEQMEEPIAKMFTYAAINDVKHAPTIEPERKTGKWILIRIEENGNGLYECSECHKGEIHVPIVEVKYCWNCGTKMEGGEQDA